MSKLIENIKRLAAMIKGETKSGGNTAARVGGLFEEIGAELENKYDKTEADQLMIRHNTADDSHLNVQEALIQKINDVREMLLAADQSISQDLATHAGRKSIHKTSEEIRADIVDADIPETLARVSYVEQEKAAILEIAQEYVTQGIAKVVGGAPDALDALNELAAAINNDPNFAASMMALLNSKAESVHTHTRNQINDFPASMPASDVYPWAKQPDKPSYTAAEVGAATNNHNHAGIYQPAGSYAPANHNHNGTQFLAGHGEYGGYSFMNDVANDTGMFSNGDGDLYFKRNGEITAFTDLSQAGHIHGASQITEETNKRFMTDAERSKLANLEINPGIKEVSDFYEAATTGVFAVQGNAAGGPMVGNLRFGTTGCLKIFYYTQTLPPSESETTPIPGRFLLKEFTVKRDDGTVFYFIRYEGITSDPSCRWIQILPMQTSEIQTAAKSSYDDYTETGKYYVFNVPGGPSFNSFPYFALLEVEVLPNGTIYQTVKNITSGIIAECEIHMRAFCSASYNHAEYWSQWVRIFPVSTPSETPSEPSVTPSTPPVIPVNE